MAVIVTEKVVKTYSGRVTALNGVSLRVEKGEIFGLLGQNGAGKTTLVKILLGILSVTDGGAELLGEPVGTTKTRRKVGYLPEDHRFPDYHTGASLLDFYGTLLEMSAGDRRRRIPEVLASVGLEGRMHSKIRTYSKGMKQRLGIAQALIHDPEVIFLDEPTDGVDPVGRREIREMLDNLKSRGVTIFLNSHLLSEVELICDRVVILDRGEIIRQGTVAELTKQKGMFQVGLADGQKLPEDEIRGMGYAIYRSGLYHEIGLTDGQSIDPVVDLLRAKGMSIRHLVEKRQSLEDLFLETHEDQSNVKKREKKRDRRAEPEEITAVEAVEEDRRS